MEVDGRWKMAFLIGFAGRQTCSMLVRKSQMTSVLLRSAAPMATATPKELQDEFWKKNKDLGRPLSPHLQIYKIDYHTLLSGTHRLTGFLMYTGLAAFGAATLAIPAAYPAWIAAVKTWPITVPFIVYPAKFGCAFTLFYHLINGLRHLGWDYGKGFEWKTVYQTGYFAMGLALILAAAATLYVPSVPEEWLK